MQPLKPPIDSQLRHENNHSDGFKKQCLQLAAGIADSYGQPYAKAIQYLKERWGGIGTLKSYAHS